MILQLQSRLVPDQSAIDELQNYVDIINMKYSIFLLAAFIAGNALASRICSEEELINIVCNNLSATEAGLCTECISDAGQYDKSGRAYTTDELEKNSKKLSSHQMSEISDERYERLKVIFNDVIKSYQDLFTQMPQPDKDYFSMKLSSLKILDKNAYKSNFMTRFFFGASAYYDPDLKNIKVMPALINTKGISSYEVSMMIAHEMAHYFYIQKKRSNQG